MWNDTSPQPERVRAAELIAALCLATDLGMAFPFEHGLKITLIATRLADRLEVDRATTVQTYFACLLSHSGCTTDAHVAAPARVQADAAAVRSSRERHRQQRAGGQASAALRRQSDS